MAYRIAKALDKMRDQVNALSPKRNKASDGWIGDSKHASRKSDHNPWVKDGKTGVVTALDITHSPTRGVDAGKIAEAVKGDPRVKYVIWNRKIWNASIAKAWRNYTGSNPHTKHVHISVKSGKAHYDDVKPWDLGIAEAAKVAASLPPAKAQPPAKATLKRGSKGGDVFELQRLLGVTIDGSFGPKTEAAVKAFQKAQGLVVDGIAGPYTWEVLEAKPASAPKSESLKSNPEIGMDRLQKVHGWPKHHAAAFIGRAQQESYPEIRTGVEGDKNEPTGSAHGAWQWRMDREKAMRKFAADRGKPWTDWPTQIDFMVHELAGPEKRAGELLKKADTLEKAVEAAMAYTRPAGFTWNNPRTGHGWSNTWKNAKALMAKEN